MLLTVLIDIGSVLRSPECYRCDLNKTDPHEQMANFQWHRRILNFKCASGTNLKNNPGHRGKSRGGQERNIYVVKIRLDGSRPWTTRRSLRRTPAHPQNARQSPLPRP